MNVKWNGYGCVKDTLDGKLLAPMQHRVLVPFIMRVCGLDVPTYLWIKAIAIIFAMFASYLYFGSLFEVALLTVYMCLVTIYDYSDTYIELGLFAIVFTWIQRSYPFGELVIPICAFVGALNRETAIFIPVATLMSGWWMIGTGALVAYGIGIAIPLLLYGYRPRYCGNNSIMLNVRLMKQLYSSEIPWIYEAYTHFFIFMAMFVFLYAVSWPWTGVEIAMALLVLAPLLPATWREIRVYAPAMLALIPMGVSYL